VGERSVSDVTQPSAGTPAFAVVDAHQHFWDPKRNYYPWLNDTPRIPFRYGDYGAICRPYLPPDYRADALPWVVDKSVYVEAEWDPRDPVGETRYIAELRREHWAAYGDGRAGMARRRRRAPHSRRTGGVRIRAQRASQTTRQRCAQ
jgi:predicted TIM-barrel fold metal-dependent hydrolase